MRNHHLYARIATLLCLPGALMLAGCGLGAEQTPHSTALPTEPSVLVSSTMQNPQGFAAGYGNLYLVALNPSDGSVRWRYQTDWHPYQDVGEPVEADGIVYTVSDPVPSTSACPNPQGSLVALAES